VFLLFGIIRDHLPLVEPGRLYHQLRNHFSSITLLQRKCAENGVNSKIRRFFLLKYGNKVPVPYDLTLNMFFPGGYRMMDS
jgi:hypothetical protein